MFKTHTDDDGPTHTRDPHTKYLQRKVQLIILILIKTTDQNGKDHSPGDPMHLGDAEQA